MASNLLVMEHTNFNPEHYRDIWQKEIQQLNPNDLFPTEETLRLIHSRRRTHYQRRCLIKNLQLLLSILLLLASLMALYATILFCHPFWSFLTAILSALLLFFSLRHAHDRYLLWRIRPQNFNNDHLLEDVQRLNQRTDQRWQRLHFFVNPTPNNTFQLRWAPITGTLLVTSILFISFAWLFPFSNQHSCHTTIANTQEIVCNQSTCNSNKYQHIAIETLLLDNDFPQTLNMQ